MGSTFARMGFRRHTHGEDGKPLPGVDEIDMSEQHTWVLHMLEPDRAMSFDELASNVWKYNADFLEKPEDRDAIAYGLARLVESGLATVEVLGG